MTHRILMVCLGNICRSPTAEGVVRAIAAREFPGLCVDVDSAGTANYHVGEPPDRRTIAAAKRRGYELAALRARQLQEGDFTRFDYVLAMDRANLAEIEQLAPPDPPAHLGLFLDFSPACGSDVVPDPYYGGTEQFERVLDLCEAGARGLLLALAASGEKKARAP
jgi:protein-tyrosine phosphatase